MGRIIGFTILAAVDLNAANSSSADEFGCPASASAYGGLTFDDAQHRLWYRRFWTGTCNGLPFFRCVAGRPYWSETMQRMGAKAPVSRQAEMRLKSCIVGKLVGYEWAKDNGIRRIDTDMVYGWINRLDNSAEPLTTLDDISAEAQRRLGR